MIETQAVVMKIEGSVAYLQAQRKSSCSGCSESSCGTSVLANFLGQKAPLYRARNEADARVGDRVVVGMDESALFKGTLMLYLFPLLLLFAGAAGGSILSAGTQAQDAYAVAGAAIGLVAGYLGLKLFSARFGLGKQSQPVILSRVVEMPVRVVELEGGLKK